MNIRLEDLNQVQMDLCDFSKQLTSITLLYSGGISSHGEVSIVMQASRDVIDTVLAILQGGNILPPLESFQRHMKALNFSMRELIPFWKRLGVEVESCEALYAAFYALEESAQALGAQSPDVLSNADFKLAEDECRNQMLLSTV